MMAILVITETINGVSKEKPSKFLEADCFLMTCTCNMHLALSSRGVITKYSEALNLFCGVLKISQNWLA